MSSDGILEKMVSEATDEVANKGWKEASQNAVTLAAFGMLSRQIKSRIQGITKPFWWIASVFTAGVLSYVISNSLA